MTELDSLSRNSDETWVKQLVAGRTMYLYSLPVFCFNLEKKNWGQSFHSAKQLTKEMGYQKSQPKGRM